MAKKKTPTSKKRTSATKSKTAGRLVPHETIPAVTTRHAPDGSKVDLDDRTKGATLRTEGPQEVYDLSKLTEKQLRDFAVKFGKQLEARVAAAASQDGEKLLAEIEQEAQAVLYGVGVRVETMSPKDLARANTSPAATHSPKWFARKILGEIAEARYWRKAVATKVYKSERVPEPPTPATALAAGVAATVRLMCLRELAAFKAHREGSVLSGRNRAVARVEKGRDTRSRILAAFDRERIRSGLDDLGSRDRRQAVREERRIIDSIRKELSVTVRHVRNVLTDNGVRLFSAHS